MFWVFANQNTSKKYWPADAEVFFEKQKSHLLRIQFHGNEEMFDEDKSSFNNFIKRFFSSVIL